MLKICLLSFVVALSSIVLVGCGHAEDGVDKPLASGKFVAPAKPNKPKLTPQTGGGGANPGSAAP